MMAKTTEKVPATIEELFENWHGKYQMPTDLKGWQSMGAVGKELW